MKNRKSIFPEQLSISILNQTVPAGINFRVDIYFDQCGDDKSRRKLLNRKFYYSFKTYNQIIERFHSTKKYYGSKVVFSTEAYKNAEQF